MAFDLGSMFGSIGNSIGGFAGGLTKGISDFGSSVTGGYTGASGSDFGFGGQGNTGLSGAGTGTGPDLYTQGMGFTGGNSSNGILGGSSNNTGLGGAGSNNSFFGDRGMLGTALDLGGLAYAYSRDKKSDEVAKRAADNEVLAANNARDRTRSIKESGGYGGGGDISGSDYR